MRVQGMLTNDQVKAIKAAGMMIYYIKPRFHNVVAFPRPAANQEMKTA